MPERIYKSSQKKRDAAARDRAAKKIVFRPIIESFLSRPCIDCGVQYPLPAMQPDHVRGKKYKISWFKGGNGTLELLEAELAKCEVRCANCHCVRHALEK